jgi:tetratricopeptide (TPR) repeat protein
MTLAEVRALREAGRHDEHLAAARELVRLAPDDVNAQVEAAYGLDHAGLEREAIRHYEVANEIGIPESERRRFTVGFGSTLRNVGRADDAVAILARAVADDPDYAPFGAFLALALFSAGHPKPALAAMLGAALDAARPDAFDGYERALTEYHRALLA